MKTMKIMGIVAVLLCMMLSLCACGSSTPAATEAPETEAPVVVETEAPAETEPSLAEGMVVYTVKVVDEGGNPIAGAMVQLCKDSCVPGVTDAEGVALFALLEDDYKASMLTMPAGYEYADEVQEFYFEDAFEVTIVLKAVA